MNIYIAVLYICLGDTCNFMQGQVYHKTEQQCRVAIDVQKMHLSEMAKDTGKPTLLEGTCIKVEIPRNNV